ncbi:MAG: hypothetical protein ABL949_13305, partial [Fimbriimonadaceae bacterium]
MGKILILESNLMWSARLAKSVSACAFEPVIATGIPTEHECSIAIINLANYKSLESAKEDVSKLKASGCTVIGHAGHKEKPLFQVGEEAGCDLLVTNGELTWKIEKILKKLGTSSEGPQS